jgi:hypothetical protein
MSSAMLRGAPQLVQYMEMGKPAIRGFYFGSDSEAECAVRVAAIRPKQSRRVRSLSTGVDAAGLLIESVQAYAR